LAADTWARTLASEMAQASVSLNHGQPLAPGTVGLTAVYSPGIVQGGGWCGALAAGSSQQDPMCSAATAGWPDQHLRDALNDFLAGKAVREIRGYRVTAASGTEVVRTAPNPAAERAKDSADDFRVLGQQLEQIVAVEAKQPHIAFRGDRGGTIAPPARHDGLIL
jgi:hypothetical protein